MNAADHLADLVVSGRCNRAGIQYHEIGVGGRAGRLKSAAVHH
jgi:hypothetical protein